MTRSTRVAFAVAVSVATPSAALGQLNATVVGSGLVSPVGAASLPGSSTLYVIQQGGQVRTLNTMTGATAEFLNISSGFGMLTGGERGLLGMAFHPNFANNGLFYVRYTADGDPSPVVNDIIRVQQFEANPATGMVIAGSQRTVIEYDHSPGTNHNAGWIGFNPRATGGAANHLWIPSGDGGGSNDPENNAQNLNSLQGKLLRIDVGNGLSAANPNYAIPAGNMTGTGVRQELFAFGLRNPFQASFDRATGHMYIGDVGQNTREEVDFITNGATGGINFGWDLREGRPDSSPPLGFTDPIFDYTHASGLGQSITGGYVYRGPAVDDSGDPLDGTYFFGDFVSGRVFSFQYDGVSPSATGFEERTAEFGLTARSFSITSFAEDGFGDLYMFDINGTAYRMVPVPEPASVGLAGVVVAGVTGWRRARRRAG